MKFQNQILNQREDTNENNTDFNCFLLNKINVQKGSSSKTKLSFSEVSFDVIILNHA